MAVVMDCVRCGTRVPLVRTERYAGDAVEGASVVRFDAAGHGEDENTLAVALLARGVVPTFLSNRISEGE